MENEPYILWNRRYLCKCCHSEIQIINDYCLRSDLHRIYNIANTGLRRLKAEDYDYLPSSFCHSVRDGKIKIIQTRGDIRAIGDIMLF